MSLLQSIFNKKPKRDLFHGLLLTETSFVHYIFEKTSTEISIDYEDAHSYSQKFDKVLDDVDEALFDSEKRVHQKIDSVIFFVPTYSVEAHNKEVSQPYRRAISEIVKNLELNAMGYIETFDIFKSFLPKQTFTYIEADTSESLIGVVSDDTLTHRQVMNTDVASIVTKVHKLSHPGSQVVVQAHNQVIADQIIHELDGYACTALSHTDFNLGLLQLLQVQLLGIAPEVANSESVAEDPLPAMMPDDSIHEEDVPATNTEVIYSKHTLTSPDESSIEATTIDMQTAPATIEDIQVPHKPKHGDVVHGFKLHHSAKKIIPPNFFNDSADVAQEKTETGIFQEPTEFSNDQTDDILDVEEDTKTLPKRSLNMKTWISVALLLIGASIVFLAVYEYVFHMVKIEIVMPTRAYQKEIQLMGMPVTKSVEEKEVSVDIPVTGKRDIGERAKGQISILNFQNKVASLSAGTKLTSNDRTYQLDADVLLDPAKINLEKRSIDATSKSVAASATFIGPEGNIEKNKQLTVDGVDPSAMAGIVETSFTGGTSKSVSAVSSADIKSLRLAIADKAKVATTSLLDQKPQDSLTLDSISKVDVGDIDFSASAGQVASQLSGTAQVKSELYSVQKSLIEQKTHTEMIKSDPYARSTEGVSQYVFKDVIMNESGDTADLILDHQTKVFTSIPVDQIKTHIQPALLDASISSLKSQLKATNIVVTDISAFKLWGGYLPLFKKNIDISVTAEK
jgi:hypothetical protein